MQDSDMENGKRWQDWLTSVGTVIALILGGVTFYYQFLRKPRELTAVVLPVGWIGGVNNVSTRLAIWNDGSRDEVVESGKLLAEYSGPGKVATETHLFGPIVIKPGEAKAFTVITATDTPDSFRASDASARRLLPRSADGDGKSVGKEETLKLILELKTIDREADVILHRFEMGELLIRAKDYGVMRGGHGKRLNLLEKTPGGDRIFTTVRSE